MSELSYVVQAAGDRLHVNVRGDFNPDALFRMVDEIESRCSEAGLSRAFVDFREVGPPKSEFHRFAVGSYVAQRMQYRVRVAILWRKEYVTGLLENSALNRGGLLRVFETEAEADAWLAGHD